MKKNVFMKVFFSSVIWTAACLGLAAYAANKAQQQDPEILQKVGERVQSTSNVHISFGGASDGDYVATEDSWTFKVPTEAIELTSINGDVEVVSAKAGSPLTVTAKGKRVKSQAKLLDTEVTQQRVSLNQPDGERTRSLKIRLSIPEDFKGKLQIKTISGDMELNSLTLNSLQLQSVSGDVAVRGASVKSLEQNSVSGDVKLENKIRGTLNLKTVSGDLEIRLVKAEKTHFDLNTMSGTVKNAWADDPKGDATVRISSTSGDINISR